VVSTTSASVSCARDDLAAYPDEWRHAANDIPVDPDTISDLRWLYEGWHEQLRAKAADSR
jgi:hypothetical protein